MSHLEPPPESSADFLLEKPPETEIPGPSTHIADCTPSSTGVDPEDRHAKVRENFKGMIFQFAIASTTTKTLSPAQTSLIEQRLDEFFPSFCTLDHPPYSAMIEAAIQKLDQKGASSEEAISQFIRKVYPNLPWAHDILLKHHLQNLCENGSIIKASNGLYMLGHVVTKRDSTPSPCSSIGAYSSISLSHSCSPCSSSWSSSSWCSSPRLKRKRLLYTKRRKRQGRKRGSKNKRSNKGKVNRMRCAQVPKRRQWRPPRKDLLEDETETNTEHLMLEENSEETEAQNKSKEGCNEGAESINQVRGKRQKIRKQDQRQETRLVIDIQLDKHEDMVDEEQRHQQALENLFIRGSDQAEAIEIQHQTGEYHEEAKEEQGCQVIEQIQTKVITGLQQEGDAEEWEQEAFSREGRREVAAQEGCKVIEEESLLKKTNFQANKEQSQVEGHDIVSKQEHRNTQKRESQLQNRGVKGRKAHQKPTCKSGSRTGRPRKKFLLVEDTQSHAKQMKSDIQHPMLEDKAEVPEAKYQINKELAEVVEDHDQLQGNMHETLEWSRAEDIHTVSEIGKSGSVGEVNKLIKQCNFVMEVEQQKGEGVEECDEQKEHENFEGIEGQSQLEEHNIVPEQDQGNRQKRKGRPLKRSVKRRKVHPKPKRVPGRGRGRPRKKDLCVEKTQPNEEQMEATAIQDPMLEEKTEVPEQKYEANKEWTEVVEEQNQSQRNIHETLEGNPAEETEMEKEIRKSRAVSEENKLIKQCNLVMEGEPQNDEATRGCDEQKEQGNLLGSEEKIQLEEPNIVPKQDQRNEQNRKGQLLNRGAKGRKVHLKHSCIPGKGMGGPRKRPHKKDILVERSRVNAEQIETTDIHDPLLEENTEVPDENCEINKECSEVAEDCSELKGNMHGTVEWSQVDETKMVKEVRKPGIVAEENLPIKQHGFLMEGEQQKNLGVKGFNEQKEHENENAVDKEQNQSAKEKNEMTFGENLPKRREHEERNQQLEEHMQSVTEKEVEVPDMHGQNTRIQENIQPEGQYESITKTLLLVDVAERSMDCKAIVLAKESFGSVLEKGKEISNKSMEQQREFPGEEKVLEIGGRQTEVIEQKPGSSTACKSQLKSVQRSSQPQNLQQQQPLHAEEKPQDGQLRSRSPKFFSSCGIV